MNNATMNRNFNPERSPLIGIAATIAAAVTMSLAVVLPAQLAPTQARIQAPAVAAAPAVAPVVAVDVTPQVVRLPSVEVTSGRPTKAASNRYNVPAVFKQKS